MVECTVLRFPPQEEGAKNRLPIKPRCEFKNELIIKWYGSSALPYPEEAYENLVNIRPKSPNEYTWMDKLKRFFSPSCVIAKTVESKALREDWPECLEYNELTLYDVTEEEKDRILSSSHSIKIIRVYTED